MRLFRLLGYAVFFLITFIFFLYLLFPYGLIQERLISAVQQQLGSQTEVTVESFRPYRFSGIAMKGLSVRLLDPVNPRQLLKIQECHGRVSLFSLIFGRPRINFSVQTGKGSLSGQYAQGSESDSLFFDLNNVDLASFPFLANTLSVPMTSQIDGAIDMELDKQRWTRSSGKIALDFRSLGISETELSFQGQPFTVPQITLAKGRKSGLQATLNKGVLSLEGLRFEGGDLGLQLAGKILLSDQSADYRLNLTGSFSATEKLNQALPFLFIIEKQRQPDGTYPLSLSGRVANPSVKIGNFTLPI